MKNVAMARLCRRGRAMQRAKFQILPDCFRVNTFYSDVVIRFCDLLRLDYTSCSSGKNPHLPERQIGRGRAVFERHQSALKCRLASSVHAMLQRRPYLREGLAELARMMVVDEIARVLKPVRERAALLAHKQQNASAAAFVLRHIHANFGVEFAQVARGEPDRVVKPGAVLLQKPVDEACRDQADLVLAAEDPG